MNHKTCSIDCALVYVAEQNAKKLRKKQAADRKETKLKLEAIEPLEYWLKKTEKACNAYIRKRDEKDPCISCGRTNADKWDAGHFISVGSNRTLRFNEDNIHKQCARPCNYDKGGNHILYRQGLIRKIGEARVLALEAWHPPVKMTREKAQELEAYFKRKLKELENE